MVINMIAKLISALITVAVCFGIGAAPNLVNVPEGRREIKTVRITDTAPEERMVGAEAVPASAVTEISEEEALKIALDRAGLTAEQIKRLRINKERDGGIWVYEIEFAEGFTEYDYSIRVSDGTIVDFDKDFGD